VRALAPQTDVAFGTIDSPFGPLSAAVTGRGLLALSYGARGNGAFAKRITTAGGRLVESPELLDPIGRELDEYFSGTRHEFDLPIDWSLTRGFSHNVLRATARIPFGSVATYADVARRAGSPNAYRAACNALSANPIPIVVPCHRVVRTGGDLGGYTGGLDRKRRLLAIES
jgi:methylated-DNA-[protein]-cysteine S-methyltransferase